MSGLAGVVHVQAATGSLCAETGEFVQELALPDAWRRAPTLTLDAELAFVHEAGDEFALRRDARGRRVVADLAAFLSAVGARAEATPA